MICDRFFGFFFRVQHAMYTKYSQYDMLALPSITNPLKDFGTGSSEEISRRSRIRNTND